jgi:Tol biopolymer transport system component
VYSPITQSPDGGRFAFVSGDPAQGPNSLMVARIDGTDVRRLASRPWPGTFDEAGPAWSPDGKWIAVGGYQGTVGVSGAIALVSTDDGSEKLLGPVSWGGVSQLAWNPDGSGLLMAAADQTTNWFYQLWFLSYPDGKLRRISADPDNYASMSVSADGTTALTLQSDWLSTVWTAPAGEPRRASPVTDGRYDGFGGVAWAGDSTIVFGTRDWGIWSVGADGTNRKLLTVGENNNMEPCVPRDASRVVFFASWRNPAGIWRMDLDGGNVRLVVNEEGLSGLECTPDGQWLLFQSAPSEIRRIRVDGTPAPPLEARIAGPLAVSPDGRRIACLSPDPTAMRFLIDVIPFDGGAPEQTLAAPSGAGSSHALRWTADGRALSYDVTSSGVSNIWMQQVAGGPATQVTGFTEGVIWSHSWAADGRLALARGRVNQDIVLVTLEGRKEGGSGLAEAQRRPR